MEYLQEDPYSSHHFAPQDPYNSGGYEGGYPSNTSFDRQSDHSMHSDRNRMVKNYSDIPNGAPYSGSGNIYPADQMAGPDMHDSPQPPRSITPPEYLTGQTDHLGEVEVGGRGSGGYQPRESPYHNLPPYHEGSGGGRDNYEEYQDPEYYSDDCVGVNPPAAGYLPSSSQSPLPPYADDMHDGYGQREGSYAGSRGSFQGTLDGEPHLSGNYPGDIPRYNGGVHYPEDTYGYQGDREQRGPIEPEYLDQGDREQRGPIDPEYLDQGDREQRGPIEPEYLDQGGREQRGPIEPEYLDQGDREQRGSIDPEYLDQGPPHDQGPPRGSPHNHGPMYNDQPSFLDDRMYPDDRPRSTGPRDDPYQPQQLQNSSFHDPRHDSYQGATPPMDPYDLNRPPSSARQHVPYQDQDRYSDAPRQRGSMDPPLSGGYPAGNYMEQGPPLQPNDSFRDDRNTGDIYADDPQRRFDGLPPVRADPFADDPFRVQHSREPDQLRPLDDPYYRGNSPSGGPDPVPYDDRAPPYDDRAGQPYDDRGPPYDDQVPPYDAQGPPYDDRGPPYDDRGPPYDERDGPDQFSQIAPRYPSDYPQDEPYYPEQEATRRLEELNLGAPTMPVEGRRTPSVDGREHTDLPTRYPDLQEVIDFMSSPDDSVKASAAAHLQHVTYMDDSIKAKTRSLGGLRPLIRLLSHDLVEVHKNACGALQNLSYGKANNDNKRAIKNEGGIPELIKLLRKTDQEDVKESVTGVLWNLSSCEDVKQSIVEDGLGVLVNVIILKYSGYGGMTGSSSQLPWTAVCKNTTGILRNVSSSGFDARKRLRECRGLVSALIYMLKLAADDEGSNDIDNKVVENTVCVLRNLSYRIQEVVDPDFYKKRMLPRQQGQAGNGGKGADGPGCFGNKSNKAKSSQAKSGNQMNRLPPQLPPSSVEYRCLWGPEIHSLYSTVLKRCTNAITMEAAAGAIQNLTACDWQPAVESRAMVRKEKGLPLLVDLLSAESDRVVCATATALRNLAIDDKNKELVGKYAIRQLVNRLPRDNRNNLPDDTICAVVATLYEVVKDNQDFALALVQEYGLRCLMHINNSEGRYLSRTLKFTLTLLKTLWGYKSLHLEYSKLSYGQVDFTTSKAYPRQDGSHLPDTTRTPTSSNHTTPYNTLSRPMSGQGYDDNILTPARAQQMKQRFYSDMPSHGGGPNGYQSVTQSNTSLHDSRGNERLNYSKDRIPQEDIQMSYMGPGYAPLDEPRPHRTKPPTGGVPLFPNLAPVEPSSPSYCLPQAGSEPLYAQVNKVGRRRGDHPFSSDGEPPAYDSEGVPPPYGTEGVPPPHGPERVVAPYGSDGVTFSSAGSMDRGGDGGGADSWV